ncbi:trichothecene 15-O-acetyltransferase, partial [Aspergillus hancockii]
MNGGQPKLPPLSPEAYRWKRSDTDPSVMQRRGNGAEATAGIKDRNSKGDVDMYMLITLHAHDISTTTTPSLFTIEETLQAALLDIRFKHPEIACAALWDDHVAPIIQYIPPKSHEEACTWARNAVQIRATPQTGHDVWMEIERQRRAADSGPANSVTIYAIADVVDENTPLTPGTALGILIHMNHLYSDGIGMRMFASDLLQRLGRNFNAEQKQYPWGEEIANLSLPVLDALDLEIGSLADDFQTAREEYVKSCSCAPSSWGLKYNVGDGTPRTISHTFTTNESEAIICALKHRLGPKYTITHLGQAAVVLALLKANPPPDNTSDDQFFITAPPLDGRRWLRKHHAHSYYSICLTGAVIEFENIKSLMVDSNDKKTVIEALETGCKITKQSYDRWLSNSFQLPLGISIYNHMASFMSLNQRSSNRMAGPLFISDGLNDRFIQKDIVSRDTGETLMSVDHIAFFTNQYQPYMLLRLDSWKGACTLSLCFNDGSYTADEATTFLEDV